MDYKNLNLKPKKPFLKKKVVRDVVMLAVSVLLILIVILSVHLKKAEANALGRIDPQELELIGCKIDNVQKDMEIGKLKWGWK